MDSLSFLGKQQKKVPPAVLVACGNEPFLRSQVMTAIRHWVVGPDADDFCLAVHMGDKAEWTAVRSDVETRSFFGGRRLVIVEEADPFVSANREKLLKYVAEPSTAGVLALSVKTWSASTKLAKAIPANATITCKAPAPAKLIAWAQQWCVSEHERELLPTAARLLVDLVGPDMGLLNQEMAKLAVYVGDRPKIEPQDVDLLVGNNRAEKTFAIFDLIGKGKTAETLAFLDHLLTQGEDPLRLLGAFGWHLRRLAMAARLSTQGTALTLAIKEVGLYQIPEATQQLRHLGLRRINRIYEWLIEVDLGMKGDSTLPPRTMLERLIIRLARPNPQAVGK